jgi:hypothetical protein
MRGHEGSSIISVPLTMSRQRRTKQAKSDTKRDEKSAPLTTSTGGTNE